MTKTTKESWGKLKYHFKHIVLLARSLEGDGKEADELVDSLCERTEEFVAQLLKRQKQEIEKEVKLPFRMPKKYGEVLIKLGANEADMMAGWFAAAREIRDRLAHLKEKK